MFTINNKPIFNSYNLSILLRGSHLKTSKEKIENYIKYIKEIVFVRSSVVKRNKARQTNKIDLNRFCELNPKIQFHSKQINFQTNTVTSNENIIEFEYQNLFALDPQKTFDNIVVSNKLTPEEIKMRKEWDISLRDIGQSWGRNIFVDMLPKFDFNWEDITPEFINILLVVFTLITKAMQLYLININDGKLEDLSWDALDKFINDLNSELRFENDKLVETDKSYNLITMLCCGRIEFYHKIEDVIIYTPLLHLRSGSDNELLENIYNLFIENPIKYNHLISCLVHNFVKDELDVPLKIVLPRNSLFLGEIPGDNIVDLTFKICNIIFNKTNIKSVENDILYIVHHQIKSLYEFGKKYIHENLNYEVQKEKYLNAKSGDDINNLEAISKFQINIKNAVAIRILTEVASGEKLNFAMKFKGTTKFKVTNYIVSLWDNLINDIVNDVNINELIGCDHHDIKDFMDSILNSKFIPSVANHYLNTTMMYVNRKNPEFIKWVDYLCKFERLHKYCVQCWDNIKHM